MSDSVLTLIDAGKWRSALFTSFTLSLTYLESHVLPRLRKQCCQSLTVVVDKAGYRDSLMEQRARSVGRDYSVVPMSVKGGIFHPKLVHLRAHEGDEDLLLVGSGNLTYSGHGGNVEVLEALRPSAHAAAFRQAASFFARLLKDPRVSIADEKAMAQTAARLSEVASRGGDTEAVRFIDNLDISGQEQLLDLARDLAPQWQELVVLSPYHHPRAEPVQTVLKELGITRLVVGVSTKAEGSAFPFEVAGGFALNSLTAQVPIVERGAQRTLHAKWFELRRPGSTLVLSGSFNATKESFASTSNVECGVLRQLPESTSALWKDAPIPPYVRGEFPTRSGAADICLFASLDSASRLAGRFVDGGDCKGLWEARLQNAEQVLATDVVEVAEGGAFAWQVPSQIDEITAQTLQLTLLADGRQARGWVQVSRVLNMRMAARVLLQSLDQLNRGENPAAGANPVLDYVLQEFGNLLGASKSSTAPPKVAPPAPGLPGTGPVTATAFEALKDPWGVPAQYDGGLLLDAVNGGRRGWDLLKHVCAALMARPTAGGPPSQPGPGDCGQHGNRSWGGFGGGVPLPPTSPQGAQTLSVQLTKAQEALEKQLHVADIQLLDARTPEARQAIEAGRSRMLLMASWVDLRFRLLDLGDVEAALLNVWQWLKKTCDLRLDPEKKEHLDSQVCGVAAACALWLMETPWAPNDYSQSPKQVHRLLNRYFGGRIDAQVVQGRASMWLQEPAGLALTQGRVDDALTALREVLGEPTELQVLAGVLRDGLEAHQSDAAKVFDAAHLTSLQRMLKGHTASRPRYSTVDPVLLSGCPKCNYALTQMLDGRHHVLNPELSWQLRLFGFARCPREDYYLVNREAA